MMHKWILLTTSCLIAAGCGSFSVTTPPPKPAVDPAEVTLAEAAVSVSHSLNELAAIRRAETPAGKLLADPQNMMFLPVDSLMLDWSGPIEPLLQKVSASINYRLRVIGRHPAIPIIVTLKKNAKVAELLRDIDYQAGEQGSVRVYPSQRTIELRYVGQ